MLTANELSLITSAVDGELTPEQVRVCRRLLADKPAAAQLYRQLKADAARVKALPRPAVPAGLAARVMAQVAALPPHASVEPVVPAGLRRRLAAIAPYAVAASLLLAVALGTSWYLRPHGEKEQVAWVNQLPAAKPLPPDRQVPILTDYVVARPDDSANLPNIPAPRLVPDPQPPVVIAALPAELAPLPRPAAGDIVGFGIVENTRPLTAVDLRLPFVTSAIDFDKPDVRERLTAELALDPAYRLDLFSKNPQAAIDLVVAAAKKVGVTVSIDAASQERLAKKLPVATALYVEGLSAADILAMLAEVAVGVQAATPPAILGANLVPAQAQEQRDVKDLFGVDLGLLRTPRTTTPSPGHHGSPGASGKPVSNDTIGQITNTLKKGQEKQAILLTYLPPAFRTPANQSKEVKAFLERRGERKPGTLPMIIIVRPAAN